MTRAYLVSEELLHQVLDALNPLSSVQSHKAACDILETLLAKEPSKPVAFYCEGYFDTAEESQEFCDTKAQLAEAITPLYRKDA